MDVIPLSQGELRWVFPEAAEPDAVRDALSEADAQVTALARHLGAPAGRAGEGLAFHRVEGFVLAGVFGSTEAEGVGFSASLSFPRRCLWEPRWGPPWEVEAEVAVQCDQVAECGGHTLAERSRTFSTPIGAARGLVEATAWLLERGTTEPLLSWRAREDARCSVVTG
ncbi:hypothetical protein [Streptomyces aureus]|uniref:hypothetical protein n=1 Tax=Streptomyces aureus TaxID=193461 RepID=UPI0005646BCD|nr:hypothetical protein [Streptomyces aureus]